LKPRRSGMDQFRSATDGGGSQVHNTVGSMMRVISFVT
jgi:hypothetical protein